MSRAISHKSSIISQSAFTLIEVIITLVLIGLLLIPLGIMSLEYMRGIFYSRDLGVAEGLAKDELSKVNNLAFGDIPLGDNITSNYGGYPYDLRRSVSYVSGNTALKQVQIRVYPAGDPSKILVNTITYVANVSFGAGSGGGNVGEIEANFLLVSGGSIYNSGVTHVLRKVSITNTDPSSSITITAIEVTFTGASGIVLQQARINASDGTKNRWTGSQSSPTGTLSLSPPATLDAGVIYNNTVFLNFNNKNLTGVTELIFTMGDDSKSVNYFWP